MPVSPTYPGVYVQEVPSGVRTIAGVSTSVAVFIGRATQGPLDTPVLILNYTDFERAFSSDYAGSDLARAVQLFFQNGGTQCYVMRIADGAVPSQVTLRNEANNEDVLEVTAQSPGVLGNMIRMAVTYNGQHPESTFNLNVFRWEVNNQGITVQVDNEQYTALTMEPNTARYAVDVVNQNSNLIELTDVAALPLGSGYSESGRPMPRRTLAIFRTHWVNLLNGLGLAVVGTPWTGTSAITTSGTYTGSAYKTYTFTIAGAGTLTVGTNAFTIDWDDGVGNTGAVNLAAAYVPGTAVAVAEGLEVAFGAGDLEATEVFTVAVHPLPRRFRINVDGRGFVPIDLSALDFTVPPLDTSVGFEANLATEIQNLINLNLLGGSTVTVTFETGPTGPAGTDHQTTRLLRIASANGDVRIEPDATNDLAAPLMLGSAQGGTEVARYAQRRPRANGIVFDLAVVSFAQREQTAFDTVTIETTPIDLTTTLQTSSATAARMYQDGYSPSVTGNSDGVREKWSIIAAAINAEGASDPTFRWTAELWGSRLALIPGEGGDNSIGTIATSGGDGIDIGGNFTANVRYYSLGATGVGPFQVPGAAGSDGNAPTLANYRDAFDVLERDVDLFNLMILPQDADHDAATTASLWGPASNFCEQQRAFLLMDAPTAWATVQDAVHPQTGVNSLRLGLSKDYSAIFYPRLVLRENGLNVNVGPSGAIAGLMARIDGSRGVWKAPAGTEADLRGVVGVERRFSDGENGILNPRAINTIRVFPQGIVNWGARTMDGDDDFGSEYKYIPIRRLALFMEESLYRGLKWVVFEPNDEPLWAQIRLNVGAFMHNLFRQGAFQGTKPKDAYFVKCDSETTTQNDIDLGIVNIWVGFAPLKPAEFVILYLQQMAGQIEV